MTELPPGCARRYRFERALAKGGFGSVVLATQLKVERRVAIKLLHADMLADQEQVRRFQDEARITASFSHPHVVVLLDFDVEDGVPWIAYEYLEGQTLHAMLERGALPWNEAARVASQVLAALQAAHDKGILHRDIKPHNVMQASPGFYKVTDFGIARWSGKNSVKTQTGAVIGTPAYIAPEVAQCGEPGVASDLYAVGVMLFEMLSGRRPFEAPHPVEVLRKQVLEPAPDLRPLAPQAPEALHKLVADLLAKDPAARPRSAREAEQPLAALLADGSRSGLVRSGVRARTGRSPVVSRTTARTAAMTLDAKPAAMTAVAPPAKLRAPVVAGVALLAVIGVLGAFAMRRDVAVRAPASPSATPPVRADQAVEALAARFAKWIRTAHERGVTAEAEERSPVKFGPVGELLVKASAPAEFDEVERRAKAFIAFWNHDIEELRTFDREATRDLGALTFEHPATLLRARIRYHLLAREAYLAHMRALLDDLPYLRAHPGTLGEAFATESIFTRIPYPQRIQGMLHEYFDLVALAALRLAQRPDTADVHSGDLIAHMLSAGGLFDTYGVGKAPRADFVKSNHARLEKLLTELSGPLGEDLRLALIEGWDYGVSAWNRPDTFRAEAAKRLQRIVAAVGLDARDHLRNMAKMYYLDRIKDPTKRPR